MAVFAMLHDSGSTSASYWRNQNLHFNNYQIDSFQPSDGTGPIDIVIMAHFQIVTYTFILYMKDRIKKLMESQHMNQQSFASFIGLAPATLNAILQERNKPTLNTVEAICKKMPNVNLSWLINGTGEMFATTARPSADGSESGEASEQSSPAAQSSSGMIAFQYEDAPVQSGHAAQPAVYGSQQPLQSQRSQMRSAHQNNASQYAEVKKLDKPQRRITEIRVFYDDQTWESFVPKK